MKESKVKTVMTNKSIEKLKVSDKAVIVDALIGTGLKGNTKKEYKGFNISD